MHGERERAGTQPGPATVNTSTQGAAVRVNGAGGGEVKFPGDRAGTPRRAHSASSRAAEERGEARTAGLGGEGGRWRSGKLLSSAFRGSCHSSKVRKGLDS